MRPPHSWLLTVVASLLMTSSTVMAAPTIDGTCIAAPATDAAYCKPPDSTPKTKNGKTVLHLTCNAGFILESTNVDPALSPFIVTDDLKLKAGCYSKCHPKFRIDECPANIPDADCKKANWDGPNSELSCDFPNELFVNGVKVGTPPIKCNHDVGWLDSTLPAATKVIDITKGYRISAICKAPPPVPPPPRGADTNCQGQAATIYIDDCPSNPCPQLKYASNNLNCPAGNKLMIGSKSYDHAKCAKTGWTGYKTATSPQEPLTAFLSPSKLRASCFKYCSDDMVVDACPSGVGKCGTKPTLSTTGKLKCGPDHLLIVDGKFHKADVVQCSADGWKAGSDVIVNYDAKPFDKIYAYCQPFASMFEDNCPKGFCETPDYNTPKLTCSKAHHRLVVNGPTGMEIVVPTHVESTATGWQIPGSPPVLLVVYSTKVEKLKARCFSRCHIRFVDTTCAPPCNKPIYMNEGQPLFCRSADEELFLEEKKVPDVVCDATGWREAGKPTSDLLLDFTTFTAEKVKAACKRITGSGSTPAPPVINGTDRPSNKEPKIKGESEAKTYILISLVVVLALTVGGLGMFLWRIQKKKRDDDDEGHSKTKTKSNSKNNSSKNKKGKKGNKKSKNASKKGKKGKKDSSKKQKKEKEADIDSNVEVPEHQMSEANSTVPLTAALGVGSPPNPNVMDV